MVRGGCVAISKAGSSSRSCWPRGVGRVEEESGEWRFGIWDVNSELDLMGAMTCGCAVGKGTEGEPTREGAARRRPNL